MAIDKRLKIYDDQGHEVDYDIMADDVKFMPDGKDLPTKLAEIEDEIGEGGYAPPEDGIPKKDLAQSVQDSLELADSSLQPADKTQLQGAINSLQNALNNLIGGNVQDAIDTFNEVVAFLNGIDTSDPTLKNQLLALNNAITNLGNSLAAVATSGSYNDLSNKPTILSQQQVAGMIEDAIEDLPTGDIPTKVSDLENDEGYIKASQMDNAPTAGSNNPVKSGGIKTALDNLLQNLTIGSNGNWFVGQTDTNVKAQGPAGNVNITDASQLVAILVNDLTTGGAGNILSAEMGKVLKTAISSLIDSMGEYCFPNGRPTLSWEGAKCNVTQTLTDVTSDYSSLKVDEHGELEITLSPVDNLHVFLTGDVTVEMPLGTDITSTAWNENTGKVTIADVTNDVVITAKSSTYVQSGLVFNLDAKNSLDLTTNKWKDVVGDVEFSLTNVTLNQAGTAAVFNGSTSKGVASVALNWTGINGTIESVFTRSSAQVKQPVFSSGKNKGFAMLGWKRGSDSKLLISPLCTTEAESDFSDLAGKAISTETDALALAISMSIDRKLLNGLPKTDTGVLDTWTGILDQFAVIGNNRRTSGDSYLNGTISCIRIYDGKKLTQAEQEQNYKVDKKRFNLA